MLRVGLTGGLGSGKSTVAGMLRELGAYTLSADEIARKLMEPGTPVFQAIVDRFGPAVIQADGPHARSLDRSALARIAFTEGRVEELNAIVHPATIAMQSEVAAGIERRDPAAIIIVESALIFETKYAGRNGADGWRARFDRMILVTAPYHLKIARFIARSLAAGAPGDPVTLEAEARRRLSQMIPDADKVPFCDFVIVNDGPFEQLLAKTAQLWQELRETSPTNSQPSVV